jgi:hypothetical protein
LAAAPVRVGALAARLPAPALGVAGLGAPVLGAGVFGFAAARWPAAFAPEARVPVRAGVLRVFVTGSPAVEIPASLTIASPAVVAATAASGWAARLLLRRWGRERGSAPSTLAPPSSAEDLGRFSLMIVG